jgi:predicted regulator of Ras-like GTPase activity (Roadblock/LC7/MglB family)
MGMALPDTVMFPEEYERLTQVVRSLLQEANGKVVFLVDKNGQQIASAGQLEALDTTSLASLTAGNVAATDGLARLLGNNQFSVLFHEGDPDSIHISVVNDRMILVVIFDMRSSLGLVRLRVRKAQEALAEIFRDMDERAARQAAGGPAPDSPFVEITDDDIDALFAD